MACVVKFHENLLQTLRIIIEARSFQCQSDVLLDMFYYTCMRPVIGQARENLWDLTKWYIGGAAAPTCWFVKLFINSYNLKAQ